MAVKNNNKDNINSRNKKVPFTEVDKSELDGGTNIENPLKQMSRYVALVGFGCFLMLCLQGELIIGIIVGLFGLLPVFCIYIKDLIYDEGMNLKHTESEAVCKDEYQCQQERDHLKNFDYKLKYKVLLDYKNQNYCILYVRVKSTNYLIVNGKIYDEYKGLIEFAHNMVANIDKKVIEAGLDDEGYSYIKINGVIKNCKIRLV